LKRLLNDNPNELLMIANRTKNITSEGLMSKTNSRVLASGKDSPPMIWGRR
jgi:hypothetical protein